MIPNKYLNVLVLLIVSAGVLAQSRMTLMNENWQYLEANMSNIEQARSMDNWEPIDLPHTWNALDVTDQTPGYRRTASWYRKSLDLEQLNGRYLLYFEGANTKTQLYVNGRYAGGHLGGYVGFEIELTEFLKNGANELMVRVDNGYDRQLIPSQQSDFFIYGGITRDVWLKQVPETYLSDITITTPQVSEKVGQTNIAVELKGNEKHQQVVELSIVDPTGITVFSDKAKSGTSGKALFEFKVKRPMLWDISNPNLYTVVARLSNGDELQDRYGYRWFHFEPHGPFYLNGKRLLLRGTHRHEELAGVGAALSNAQHQADIQAIKDMGANFIRLGHYPQDPEVYRACDELGLLVWDELPWCRGGIGDEVWKANTQRLLEEMIDQNINHPSIVLWSLGNEIYWLPEFEGGGDPDEINPFLQQLHNLSHQLDPYRKTAIRKYYEGADIVDVFSPSIWSGWYSGTYKNYEQALNKSLAKYDHFVHMEYGGSSHVGRHTENPITGDGLINPNEWEEAVNQVEVMNIAQNGDWSENYIVDLFDWHLQISETHPDFMGNAQWAFRDFGTPLRPENDIPYVNQKGLVDRSGKPKDAYYVFKSYWSDEPFAYIESHTWTERSGPDGVKREINVFSNADEVEFFLNGKLLGRKQRDLSSYPACGLTWDVQFEAGANELRAVAYKAGKQVATDSMTVNYRFEKAGTPDALTLSFAKLENGNLLVTAHAVDQNGLRCLDYEEKVYFQCLEGGKLVEHLGTPTGSSVIAMANGMAAIEVVPDASAATLVMTVLNQSFKGTFLEIPLLVKTP